MTIKVQAYELSIDIPITFQCFPHILINLPRISHLISINEYCFNNNELLTAILLLIKISTSKLKYSSDKIHFISGHSTEG